MPGFQFELSQLVQVPNKDQQGRISGRMEFVNDETLYQVKWLCADLTVDAGMFPESQIRDAQAPAPDWLPEVSFVKTDTVDRSSKRRSAKRRAKR